MITPFYFYKVNETTWLICDWDTPCDLLRLGAGNSLQAVYDHCLQQPGVITIQFNINPNR